MLDWLRNLLGTPTPKAPAPAKAPPRGVGRRRVRAGWDAAETTPENAKHWAATDSLSADAALDSGTRQTLRERARYEVANNCYAAGLVEQLATDLVGTGPRLYLTIPGVSRDVCRQIEQAWATWARVAELADDLHTLERSRLTDGEAFAIVTTNPALLETGLTRVSLDLQLYESEQVSDPWDFGLDPMYVDGVRRDRLGNPVSYTFLERHPGGTGYYTGWDTHVLPASHVLHWYKRLRPGQTRGVTALAAALPLFGQCRRYTLATLTAAEVAAMLAGVLQSDLPPGGDGPVSVEAMDEIELIRGALLTLPSGWEAKQFEPKQPISGYKEFKGELLTEAGRAVNVPRNVSTGDSSPYNYSSAKLDHGPYRGGVIRQSRYRMRTRVTDRLFCMWVEEAALAGAIPPSLPPLPSWQWEWYYDGFESLDPQKDAAADAQNLANNTTTLAEIYAAKGQDWEEQLTQRAREVARVKELGLTGAGVPAPAPQPQPEEVPGE